MKRIVNHLSIFLLVGLSLLFSACEIEDILDGLGELPIEQGAELAIIDSVILNEIRLQNIPGLAVAVIQNDVVTHIKGYGYQDEDRQVPVTRETLFRWASISKTYNAVMAMRLYQAGLLDLDKNIRDYTTAWPSSNPAVTMRQLLAHTGGIPHYPGGTNWAANRDAYLSDNPNTYDPVQVLDIFKNLPMGTPGTYTYSTFGSMLSAAVIDQIGRDNGWGDYLTQANALADSLNMGSMGPDYLSPADPLRTSAFSISCNGKSRLVDDEENVIYTLPGGGFRSNIKDLARFCRAIMKREVLEDSTWARMRVGLSGNNNFSYGLGFQLFWQANNSAFYGHGGFSDGARTQMYIWPNQNTGIMFLCASHQLDRTRLLTRIAAALGLPRTASGYNLQNILGCDDNTNCLNNSDNRFAGVWEQGNQKQLLRRGLTTLAFDQEWRDLSDAGYRLKDIEVWKDGNGSLRWDGVFTEGSGAYALWSNFSTTDFDAKWREMTAEGKHLIDVETYEVNGTRLWVGVFEEATGNSALWTNFSTEDFGTKWQEMSDVGYRLIDLETYLINGDRKWVGAFVEGSGGYAMYRNYNGTDFSAKRTELKNQGFKLIDIETYLSGNNRLWAGVWRVDTDQEYLNRNISFCEFLDKDSTWRAAGYILADFEVYE